MSDEAQVRHTTGSNQLWDLLKQEIYTPQEAARVLNLHERVILSAAFGGDLKARIVKGDVIDITRTDLVAWLKWRENH